MGIIKKALFLSMLTCGVTVLINFLALVLELYTPNGYIRPVNPFWIFIFTYVFFLIATIIYLLVKSNLKINRWLSAVFGILTVYLLINIPLFLDGDFIKGLSWWVPVFLLLQVVVLVFFESLVTCFLSKRK